MVEGRCGEGCEAGWSGAISGVCDIRHVTVTVVGYACTIGVPTLHHIAMIMTSAHSLYLQSEAHDFDSYLLVSDEKTVGMFVFTRDIVIGQQVCELLNEADHL